MKTDVFLLPHFFDYGATFLWAISGALVAARRGYDVVGVFALALASATGGGLLRDGIFLQNGPPILVQNPIYLQLVAAGSVVVILFGKRVQRIRGFETVISLVDGLGLGAYAVVGMNYALAAGLGNLGAVLVGMVNAVGGSVLRSMLIARENNLLKPGTFQAIAALSGCGLYMGLTRYEAVPNTTAAWITIVAVFLIRVASVAYDVRTQPLHDFEDEWKKSDRNE